MLQKYANLSFPPELVTKLTEVDMKVRMKGQTVHGLPTASGDLGGWPRGGGSGPGEEDCERCVKERYYRSFFLFAVRLHNKHLTVYHTHKQTYTPTPRTEKCNGSFIITADIIQCLLVLDI